MYSLILSMVLVPGGAAAPALHPVAAGAGLAGMGSHAAVGFGCYGGSSAPMQALARMDGKGMVTFWTVGGSGPMIKKQPREQDGKTVYVDVPSGGFVNLMTTDVPAGSVQAYRVDGKAIPADEVAELLRQPRTVLVSTNGQKVDPFFLKLIRDDAVILVPPPGTVGMGGYGYGYGYGGPSYAAPVPVPAPPAVPPTPKIVEPRPVPPPPPEPAPAPRTAE